MSNEHGPLTGIGPLLIAHRGASADLPEHTLAGKALAHGLGADFLEQDVVATRDGELVVLHDIHLDLVTDVSWRYPRRARADGRWYVRDFDLNELLALRAVERMSPGLSHAVYPDRFPACEGNFRLATLAEELTMIASLNRTTGRSVGIYPEVKKPAWHAEEGIDLAGLLLAVLSDYGFTERRDNVYVQCFDPKETARMRDELGTELRLVQLLGENAWQESTADYDALRRPSGLAEIARYADAIGPWVEQLYSLDATGQPVSTGLLEMAHDQGLAVHPYTFRADDLPPGFATYEEMLAWFVDGLGVDGLFTDFTGRTRGFLDAR